MIPSCMKDRQPSCSTMSDVALVNHASLGLLFVFVSCSYPRQFFSSILVDLYLLSSILDIRYSAILVFPCIGGS